MRLISGDADTNGRTMWKHLKNRLSGTRLPLWLACLAVLVLLPSIWIGFQMDDFYHRILLLGRTPVPMTPWQLFSGPPPDPAQHRDFIDSGIFPWWVSDGFRLSLFRPLTVLTHRIDYWLWPHSPALMHVHNLLWFGALIAAVAVLYRRLMTPAWLAGFASLLYAVDDAHAPPASWIANRNVLLACLFGVLCLVAHDRWRRRASRTGAWLAPLFLAAALASGEAALATAGYLAAYALFLEEGDWRRRLASLGPAVAVLLAWTALYAAGDYGAHGSGLYVDPLAAPLEFTRAVVARAPLLLLGQGSPAPSDLGSLLPPEHQAAAWWLAVAVLALAAVFLWPLLWRDRAARFWAAGMGLALLPICAVFPSNRLLFFVGLGAMALLATWLAGVWERASWLPQARSWRRPARVAAVLLAVVHLPLALIGTAIGPWTVRQSGRPMIAAAATLPADPAIADHELVLVNAPDYLTFVTHIPTLQWLEDRPAPRRVRALSTGPTAIEVERLDARTLRLTIERGLYAGPLGRLFRDRKPELEPGDRVAIAGLDVTIEALDGRGEPRTVRYTFATPLEDPSRRWLHFADAGWERFDPPPIGAIERLAPPRGPFDLFY